VAVILEFPNGKQYAGIGFREIARMKAFLAAQQAGENVRNADGYWISFHPLTEREEYRGIVVETYG